MSRRVLVTGAASGLGLALVRRFAAAGDRVLATDLAGSVQQLPGGRDLFPEGVRYLRLDVRDNQQWLAARDWVEAEWGGLDLLVNNAGVAGGGRIDRTTLDEWEWITDINLLGVVRGCHTFAVTMKRQHSGHIVNVASIAGLVHPPGMASYNAVKAAVVALSETLQHELAPYDIVTSVVCPSFFRTNLAASLRGVDEDVQSKAAQLIESSSLTAEEIADAVFEGIEKGEPLILTDEVARASYHLKLTDRGAYDQQMQVTARRTYEREQESRQARPPEEAARPPEEETQ
ncbi:MAG: SDR family NAD(P)-dependent oxidoreductase [Nocardioidaceae bacterium]